MHLVQISVHPSISPCYSKLVYWTTVLLLLRNIMTVCWLKHSLFSTLMQTNILSVLQMRKLLHRNSATSLTEINLQQLLEISAPHYVDLIWGWGAGGSENLQQCCYYRETWTTSNWCAGLDSRSSILSLAVPMLHFKGTS